MCVEMLTELTGLTTASISAVVFTVRPEPSDYIKGDFSLMMEECAPEFCCKYK